MKSRLRSLFSTRARSIGIILVVIGAAATAASIARPDDGASTSTALGSFTHRLQATSRPCNRTPSTRRYVSARGSDRNGGTLKRPWRTIGRALRTSVPGEAVYVRAGVYPEWAIEARGGTANAPISLRAYAGEHPVITGRLKIEGAFFCVTGFRFKGGTSANMQGVLIYLAGAHHIEILRNTIMNAFMSGIYVGDEGDLSGDVSIIGNYIRDNGTHDRFDHGVYFGHVNQGLISNNLVVGNRALGLKIEPEANDVTVTQNTVVGNGTSGITVGGEENWSSNDTLVVNNIVVGNAAWGIRSYWEQSIGSGNRALRNLVFANGAGAFWFPGGGMDEQESIRANPRFVAPGDYRLRAGSPAVNRAIRAFSMRFDFDGRRRPSGSAPDLGAFER
ncbi:MAG TPA: right-handed parallel beta-helix repeat-containing protein [Gaiellaceae bacterium]|nr:right-handed parallel beta-helix repeat-containing protein [Gaiellaceae bacterium]